MAANHALGGSQETWSHYASRKLGQITSAAALVKGAVDTGKRSTRGRRSSRQMAAPYVAILAPPLAVA